MPRDIHNDTNLSSLSTGNVYIADETSHRIRFVSVTTGNISTIAGNGNPGYNGDGIPATSSSLSYTSGVAVDSSGRHTYSLRVLLEMHDNTT